MNKMTEELAGQVALVTGASRGIGEAIAYSLASRGAHVVITARTAGGLEELEDRIHGCGGSATIAPLELTDGDRSEEPTPALQPSIRIPLAALRLKHKYTLRQTVHQKYNK